MNSNKSIGQDGRSAQIYKALDPNALQVFQDILENIWHTEKVLDNFCVAPTVTLYKNKGSKLQSYLTAFHHRQDFCLYSPE